MKQIYLLLLFICYLISCNKQSEESEKGINLNDIGYDGDVFFQIDSLNNQVLFTGKVFTQHEDSIISSEFYVQSGKMSGSYKRYYKDGKLECESSYTTGLLNGFSKSYHHNGQISEDALYSLGEKNGNYKSYYENGQLKEESKYINGKRDGVYKIYWEYGQLQTIGYFKADGDTEKRVGKWNHYDMNGVLTEMKDHGSAN